MSSTMSLIPYHPREGREVVLYVAVLQAALLSPVIPLRHQSSINASRLTASSPPDVTAMPSSFAIRRRSGSRSEA